jgi:cysteine desulfurase
MTKQVYMDNNATTPLHPEVKKAMVAALDVYGNPSSLHNLGRYSRSLIEEARAKVADLIDAEPEEIVFVGSGSEANNTVLSKCACPSCHSCGKTCSQVVRNELITTKIEHPCILETAKCLEDTGIKVTYLDVDKFGRVDPADLEKAISNNTKLVSIMMANNEIGTIQDVKKLALIAHENGAMFHTDAVQSVGKMSLSVKNLDVDFLTISAHKIYGPKGVGALYVKKGTLFCPLIRGGHQENGRRAGTENLVGIVGLGRAIELRKAEMQDEEKKLIELRHSLRTGIEKNIKDISFNSPQEGCLPGTINVSFDGAEGEAILLYLDLEGIAVSTGSACASGSLDPSHVLTSIGVPIEAAHGSVRISLGRDNTLDDVNYVVEKLTMVINKIREMSTVYRGGI